MFVCFCLVPRLPQSLHYNGHTEETKLLQDFWDTLYYKEVARAGYRSISIIRLQIMSTKYTVKYVTINSEFRMRKISAMRISTMFLAGGLRSIPRFLAPDR